MLTDGIRKNRHGQDERLNLTLRTVLTMDLYGFELCTAFIYYNLKVNVMDNIGSTIDYLQTSSKTYTTPTKWNFSYFLYVSMQISIH